MSGSSTPSGVVPASAPAGTPSSYLQEADFPVFGLSSGATQQVAQASRLIDAYCGRSGTGFVWLPDYLGNPAYMAAATADYAWSFAGGIEPGSDVIVPVSGAPLYPEVIGRPVVLGRSGAESVEVSVITATDVTGGTLTLGAVACPHAPGVMQGGLQIFEERYLPQDRSISRVAQWPVARVISGLGRYSYGRRSQQIAGNYSEFNLLAILQQFGGPPAWVPLDVNQLGVNPSSGELWIPAGLLLAYYSDVRLHYVAGWSQANLPFAIRQACANIVNNYAALGGLSPSFATKFQAGGTMIQRGSDAALDEETKALLVPFKARLWT